jgi:hypothetical protein
VSHAPTPKIKVKIKTPIKSNKELRIYSNRKVDFKISKYREVSSKKLIETVIIGIITSNETNKELKNHILSLFEFIRVI